MTDKDPTTAMSDENNANSRENNKSASPETKSFINNALYKHLPDTKRSAAKFIETTSNQIKNNVDKFVTGTSNKIDEITKAKNKLKINFHKYIEETSKELNEVTYSFNDSYRFYEKQLPIPSYDNMNTITSNLKGSKDENTLIKTSNFLDNNLREVRFFLYGLGFTGMLIVLRNTRAFTKFRRVSSIPQHYIIKNFKLRGHVRSVDGDGLLRVEHKPIFSVPLSKNKIETPDDLLPIQMAGIKILPEGVEYLNSKMINKHIWFQMLLVNRRGDLDCLVFAKTGLFWQKNLNEEMTKRGLALVQRDLDVFHPLFANFRTTYQTLDKAEKKAKKTYQGVWSKSFQERMAMKLDKYSINIPSSIKERYNQAKKYLKKLKEESKTDKI